VAQHQRILDISIVALSALALIFIGFLRSDFASFPLVVFLSTLFLFMLPGVVLVRWFFDKSLSGAAIVPISFTISAGVFAILGVPFLMLRGSLELYGWIAGAIVTLSLIGAVLKILCRKPPAQNGAPPVSLSFSSLWVPFALLTIALASMSRLRVRGSLGDIWVYLAWVREFLNADKLALHDPYFGNQIGTSRALINGWLLEQAALSKISSMDPTQLILGYLKPTLVVMSLLAFYALARTLLKSETAALLASSLYALFFMVNLTFPLLDSFGGEFIGRVAEDKFVARFLFFPTALIFAYLYLESRKWRYLLVFAFLCWAVVAVHPVGLALIGLCTAGFGLFHLAVNLRDKGAWIRTVSLGGALLSVLLAPFLYLLATGDSLVAVLTSADLDYSDPEVETNLVFVRSDWHSVLELGDNYYIMQPSLLLNPPILVALVVGLPFLFWRLKRSLASQLLVGTMLVSTTVCYVPPIATFFGNHIVLPGQMWRMAWPIPLAALMIVSWMVWEMTRYAQISWDNSGSSHRVTKFLPLVVLCTLMVVSAPASVAKAKKVYSAVSIARGAPSCSDPIFRWIGNNIQETSVVLAPDYVNVCIPAYSAQANVVSLRSGLVLRHLTILNKHAPGEIEVPQGALDVRRFFLFSAAEDKFQIIQRYEADYVMVGAGSRLGDTLKSQSGFTAIDTPGESYALYAVDRSKLRREVR
jgi:hypothetical protein